MCGKHVLWVPGTDHAGIATQSVVEKRLYRDEKKTRHDLGREEFLKKVWEWKHEKGGQITQQLRRLGASVDWSREVFTMDPKLCKAVTEAFCRMYANKKIYRAKRLVNWCPHLNTALSNIEVEPLELTGKTLLKLPGSPKKYPFGIFQEFAYKVEGTDDELVVATTRLETMLGDTAVAIHPDDPRYKKFHGKFVSHPFNGRRIPIVLDSELVDMEKGTGCVKVTPAHDPHDKECGERHKLEFITMLNDDGTVNAAWDKKNGTGAPYAGMFRYDVRLELEKKLTELGLYRGTKSKEMVIGRCSRSGDIIEPMLKSQWWVNIDEMADKSMAAVRNGDLKLIPKSPNEQVWFKWLGNKQPWCISRQLWWGHRIPAYLIKTKPGAGATKVDEDSEEYTMDMENWVVARSPEAALAEAAKRRGVPASSLDMCQDPDVLDTWFSSGLFPFSVMGWPDNTPDLQAFFPTHLLETGLDILFFWVARMVMMSLELMGTLPFKTVYLHAMVRDARGRKMSKSLGNVIDPLEIIDGATLKDLHAKLRKGNLNPDEVKTCEKEQKDDFPNGIEQCGTDALRYTLAQYTRQGKSVSLNTAIVVSNRMFCNKLWNGARFLLTKCLPAGFQPKDVLKMLAATPEIFEPRDKWILHRLNLVATETNRGMREYDFSVATDGVQKLIVEDLCNTYLELVKPIVYSTDAKMATQRDVACNVLYFSLEQSLRLLHPTMPFVTEELWQRLPVMAGGRPAETIMLCAFPQNRKELDFSATAAAFATVNGVIGGIRGLRTEYKLGYKVRPETYVISDDAQTVACCKAQEADICTLGGLDRINIVPTTAKLDQCVESVVSSTCKVAVCLKGAFNAAEVKAELKKFDKKLKNVNKNLQKALATANNMKSPAAVRAKKQAQAKDLQNELDMIEKSIEQFKSFL